MAVIVNYTKDEKKDDETEVSRVQEGTLAVGRLVVQVLQGDQGRERKWIKERTLG